MNSTCEIDEFGNKRWYNEQDQFHREDGPAAEYANGDKVWYINGKPHREDGPAIELDSGNKGWYYHGTWIKISSQEEFERYLKLKMFW